MEANVMEPHEQPHEPDCPVTTGELDLCTCGATLREALSTPDWGCFKPLWGRLRDDLPADL